ncbi:hypothetical protein niasHS_004996 [Heterodera schachtii]|uniref:Uncharacterized protein n=1 Tax=Heterodera schachtii TaxID=97005 RepID=A0ABD2JZS4_HETSC
MDISLFYHAQLFLKLELIFPPLRFAAFRNNIWMDILPFFDRPQLGLKLALLSPHFNFWWTNISHFATIFGWTFCRFLTVLNSASNWHFFRHISTFGGQTFRWQKAFRNNIWMDILPFFDRPQLGLKLALLSPHFNFWWTNISHFATIFGWTFCRFLTVLNSASNWHFFRHISTFGGQTFRWQKAFRNNIWMDILPFFDRPQLGLKLALLSPHFNFWWTNISVAKSTCATKFGWTFSRFFGHAQLGLKLALLSPRFDVLVDKYFDGKSQVKFFIERTRNVYEDKTPGGIKYERLQFPIKPAFAMTILKGQGQTISTIGIDLERDVFSHGQLYTAFSRATDGNNVRVYAPRRETDHQGQAKVLNIVATKMLKLQ